MEELKGQEEVLTSPLLSALQLIDADVKIDPRAADFPASLRPRGSVSTGAIVPSSSAAHRTSDQPLLAPEVSIKLCESENILHTRPD